MFTFLLSLHFVKLLSSVSILRFYPSAEFFYLDKNFKMADHGWLADDSALSGQNFIWQFPSVQIKNVTVCNVSKMQHELMPFKFHTSHQPSPFSCTFENVIFRYTFTCVKILEVHVATLVGK